MKLHLILAASLAVFALAACGEKAPEAKKSAPAPVTSAPAQPAATPAQPATAPAEEKKEVQK
jgi:hypothetical protein